MKVLRGFHRMLFNNVVNVSPTQSTTNESTFVLCAPMFHQISQYSSHHSPLCAPHTKSCQGLLPMWCKQPVTASLSLYRKRFFYQHVILAPVLDVFPFYPAPSRFTIFILFKTRSLVKLCSFRTSWTVRMCSL